jgi:hypothetical protein
VICGKTWFPVSELSQRLKSMSMRDARTKMNAYQEQFLVSFPPMISLSKKIVKLNVRSSRLRVPRIASLEVLVLPRYFLITYSWTGLLILDHSYLVGNLTNSKIAETKALEPLKSWQFCISNFRTCKLPNEIWVVQDLGALSNNRWLGGILLYAQLVCQIVSLLF